MDLYTPPRDANIIGIDPGTTQSAVVVLEVGDSQPGFHSIMPNDDLLPWAYSFMKSLYLKHPDTPTRLGIEMIASYGMPVGRETFETCLWIGIWAATFPNNINPIDVKQVFRKDVKMHLCRKTTAKDSNIRQALLDLFPRSGGGKTPQIGTNNDPGPLHGFAKDEWAALGVAITAKDTWRDLHHFPMTSEPILNQNNNM